LVIAKIQEIQKKNNTLLLDLNEADDLIIACVYILDANNCIEIFPEFKKKIKQILQKEYYDRLKEVDFANTTILFNQTIRYGCTKCMELLFINIEKNFLSKMFT
jgi:hypothetical protein